MRSRGASDESGQRVSEEAGLPGRETGVRECAGVGLTEQQCPSSSEGARGQASFR
jgi:hypothetical protein